MKKILIMLLTLGLIFGSAYAVFAQGSQGGGQTNQASQGQQGNDDSQQTQAAQMKGQFESFSENKYNGSELGTKTRSQLTQQRQITNEFKRQLMEMHESFCNMGEEQRAQFGEDIEALRNQIKEAHKYELQIKTALQEQARNLTGECAMAGVPEEEEIELALELAEEL
jgi:uncharacterized protein YxeA